MALSAEFVYAKLKKYIESGGATPEQILTAVTSYLDENPVDALVPRTEMTAEDTEAEIKPNQLYVFPEMTELSLTFADPTDLTVTNEYHIIFTSGETATVLTVPDTINVPDSFSIESSKVYELSILENNLTYQSWAVE